VTCAIEHRWLAPQKSVACSIYAGIGGVARDNSIDATNGGVARVVGADVVIVAVDGGLGDASVGRVAGECSAHVVLATGGKVHTGADRIGRSPRAEICRTRVSVIAILRSISTISIHTSIYCTRIEIIAYECKFATSRISTAQREITGIGRCASNGRGNAGSGGDRGAG